MFKHLKLAALTLLFSMGFAACSDDDNDYYYNDRPDNKPSYSNNEAYVLNQGNFYGGIGGSIDLLQFNEDGSKSAVVSNYFTTVNKQELGDGPQEGLRYGTRIYITVQGSNVLWVLDAKTFEIQHQIKMNQPTALCATEGYVFATNYDGNVTRIDTLHLSDPVKTLAVGPNPDGIAAYNEKVYVTISDGMNFENSYANGKKIVELNAENFSKTKEYETGLNPGQIVTNSVGEAFVVCRGNYADIAPMVQKLTKYGEVIDYEQGSLIAVDQNMLYIVDSQVDWTSKDPKAKVTIKRINMDDDVMEENFIAQENLPANPTHIDVHPVNRTIFICSDQSPTGAAMSGWVYQYNYGGQLIKRFDVGIHPYGLIFK